MIEAFWKDIGGEWKKRMFHSQLNAERFVQGKQDLGLTAYWIMPDSFVPFDRTA